jgi:hypothetical protein
VSNGPTSYSWLSFPFFAPLSGSVTQDIAPSVYAGVPEIEADVVREAASFGRQLGILSDAVLELARRLEEPAPGSPQSGQLRGPEDGKTALAQLDELVKQVKVIKERHSQSAQREAERALERLKNVDPSAYESLAAQLRP